MNALPRQPRRRRHDCATLNPEGGLEGTLRGALPIRKIGYPAWGAWDSRQCATVARVRADGRGLTLPQGGSPPVQGRRDWPLECRTC